jgi:type VI secretion system protein ImpC
MAEDTKTSVLETLMIKGKMVHDESQKPFARELLLEFANQLLQQGNVAHSNVSAFIAERIRQIDELISAQLNEILHDPKFLKLEGSRRGLDYLVSNSKTNA